MRKTDQVFDGNSLLPLWDRLDEWEKEMEDADRWYAGSLDLTDRRFDGYVHEDGVRAGADRDGRRVVAE